MTKADPLRTRARGQRGLVGTTEGGLLSKHKVKNKITCNNKKGIIIIFIYFNNNNKY